MVAYRDARAACPRCHAELEHGTSGAGAACRACRGLWLDEPVLDEMVREMGDGLGALAYAAREADREVACPSCTQPMTNVLLHGVAVERCAKGHGVWFDADELEAALRAAGGVVVDAGGASDVPNVRVGFWRGVIGAIGGVLGIVGYAAGGAVVAAANVTGIAQVVGITGAVQASVNEKKQEPS